MGQNVHSLKEVERVARQGEKFRRAEETLIQGDKMARVKTKSLVNILI